MKKILYTVFGLMMLTGCENFLDTENLTKKDNSNFPINQEDAQIALTGVYSSLREQTPGEEGQSFFVTAEILSDDRFAAGGPDDKIMHSTDHLKKIDDNQYADVWKQRYAGIFRANSLLAALDQVDWKDEAVRQKIEGEARFLRAYFYFDLCRFYGGVPLITSPQSENVPRAAAEENYALIASDLEYAIEHLPAVAYSPAQVESLGRATKWAAEALMARVFLFYTGYYQKDALPLEGGSVTKDQVIGYLNDCIANSGHSLIPDFRNLWPYSNQYTKKDYAYSTDNDLNWVGENGANTETIFAIRYTPKATWGESWLCNRFNLYFSLREPASLEAIFPLGVGWGVGTVNSTLWNEWPSKDLRREASILSVDKELPDYEWGRDKQMNETGYWQKKYVAVNCKNENGEVISYSQMLYPTVNSDYQLNNTQDLVIIRFADVLLMQSELTKTADGINRVRARVNLEPVAYSEEALRNERRWELAFEGLRYYDLLRWGIAADELQKQNGVKVMDNMVESQMNFSDIAQRLQITKGLLPIPQKQIDLSAGVLKQNDGWGNESNMTN